MAKKNFLSNTWEKIPAPVKIGLFAFAAYKTYKFIKNELELARQRAILKDRTNPIYNLPANTWEVGGTVITTPSSNVVTLAQEFYNAYNPDGWNTDETALLRTLEKTPPAYYKQVASYYANTFGRNLTQDLDEQLLTDLLGSVVWPQYKTQIY